MCFKVNYACGGPGARGAIIKILVTNQRPSMARLSSCDLRPAKGFRFSFRSPFADGELQIGDQVVGIGYWVSSVGWQIFAHRGCKIAQIAYAVGGGQDASVSSSVLSGDMCTSTLHSIATGSGFGSVWFCARDLARL